MSLAGNVIILTDKIKIQINSEELETIWKNRIKFNRDKCKILSTE